MLTTTFKLLRKNDACRHRYAVLRKALKGRRDNEPIGIVEVLDHNGLDDALWALRAVPDEQAAERDRLARLFACQCVRQVWNLLDDSSRATVEVAERYAFGEATLDDMAAARAAAAAAASAYAAAAAYAAADAASAADAYAAYAANAANAAYSAYAAAPAAAYAAAYYASYAAAYYAANAAIAAYAYAAAAADAASAADAYAAAAAAARDAQAAKFREMFG